jgi:hypothetical protein
MLTKRQQFPHLMGLHRRNCVRSQFSNSTLYLNRRRDVLAVSTSSSSARSPPKIESSLSRRHTVQVDVPHSNDLRLRRAHSTPTCSRGMKGYAGGWVQAYGNREEAGRTRKSQDLCQSWMWHSGSSNLEREAILPRS